MQERLQKLISSSGLASRRQAEEMIIAGRVTCNGNVCKLGDRADSTCDVVLVDGKPLPSASDKVYLMLHKPRGYVTTLFDEKGRPNVSQLVSDCGTRVYPVGRLDMDSEGLLIFTNDGEFANQLMHPKHEIEKTYQVYVDGFTDEALQKLKRPIVLDGYQIKPPAVSLVGTDSKTTEISVTIHEGRNRQVRRMCAAAGMRVKRLVRVAEGTLHLGGLAYGKWRYLNTEEVYKLKNEASHTEK